jgi:hypothetical protein
MSSLNCKLVIDNQNETFKLSGLGEHVFQINYTGDIDFTPLIMLLSELLDSGKNIVLIQDNLPVTTEKEQLIIETLNSIFASYNDNVTTEIESTLPKEDEKSLTEDLDLSGLDLEVYVPGKKV